MYLLRNKIEYLFSSIPILKRYYDIYSFIKHNKSVFSKVELQNNLRPIFLIEVNGMQSSHISYSYISNAIAKLYDAEIKAYFPNKLGRKRKILWIFRWFNIFNVFYIYKSFGVKNFLQIKFSKSVINKANLEFLEIKNKIKNKFDIESIKVNEVLIGDLIYDSYLMKNKIPTINLGALDFEIYLLEALKYFFFWEEYFLSNEICGINASHTVYLNAIPIRIACKLNIPSFQVNLTHSYRMNENQLFAYNDFFNHRFNFSKLSIEEKVNGFFLADERLKRRFSGEIGVDMAYSTKSAYGFSKHPRLIKKSNKTKILIAAHCFFDSPHAYGNNLFPDFYEWLLFLGNISEITDYDWYIKTHPDYLKGNVEIIRYFIGKFPKLNLLPGDYSHNQIISEGIDVCLTTYGTIGFEYAFLGVLVINASQNNPHIAYNFNLHPSSLIEYKNLLLNLKNISIKINKEEIYEYYFMQFINNTSNIFFDNLDKTISEIGGYKNKFSNIIYLKWLEEYSESKHQKILNGYIKFIMSDDYRMTYKHLE